MEGESGRQGAERRFVRRSLRQGGNQELIDALLAMPTLAVENAEPASGPFPTLVYAAGYDGPGYENSVLCEFLASHGYVVVASPSVGARSAGMSFEAADLEAQVRDVEWLLGWSSALPSVDPERMATVGFSWGGLAAILAGTRHDAVDSVIALDAPLEHFGTDGIHGTDGSQLQVPLLAMIAWSDHHDYEFLRRKEYGDTRVVKFNIIGHRNFGSDGMMGLDLTGSEENSAYYGRVGARIEAGYRAVLLQTLWMSDGYLKGDPEALARMSCSPEEHGFEPRDYLPILKAGRPGRPPVPSDFMRLLQAGEVENALAHYYRLEIEGERDRPLFDLMTMREYAYYYLGEGENRLASSLFWLNVREHPENSMAVFHLAEFYRRQGSHPEARTYYERALEIDPENGRAARALKALDEVTSEP